MTGSRSRSLIPPTLRLSVLHGVKIRGELLLQAHKRILVRSQDRLLRLHVLLSIKKVSIDQSGEQHPDEQTCIKARTAKPTTTEGFYYETGESVQKGDILLVFVGEWRSARVEKIIPPGGEFEDAHPCEEGAICLKIERGNDGTGAFPGIVVTSSDNILHEDYVFVRRLEEEK